METALLKGAAHSPAYERAQMVCCCGVRPAQRVEELSDAFGLELGVGDAMVAYLLEVRYDGGGDD